MNNPPIEPSLKIGGSAFNGNTTNAYRPIPHLPTNQSTGVVSLSRWCDSNFISCDLGYTLIKKGYLIAFRRYGSWWVRHNPDCINELLEYLGVEKLAFNIDLV